MNIIRLAIVAALTGAVLAIAGCATPQHSEPVVIERPADAFNAVGNPYKSNSNNASGSLSNDVNRLQDARRLYEQSRNTRRRSHRTNHYSQQHCLQQSDSHKVQIEGLGADAVFCQPAAE